MISFNGENDLDWHLTDCELHTPGLSHRYHIFIYYGISGRAQQSMF